MRTLLYGVGGGGGFVLLTGEIGAGKTTVCRCFLEQIPRQCNVAYIFNPKLTAIELVKSICDEFRIPYRVDPGTPPTVKTYVDALNEFLLRTHAVGQNNVLIIDEAQLLAIEVLEQLRLLTNLETNEKKLLQIVLIGQPELRTMLEKPELEQLAQRVVARFHLKALSEMETEHYIRHRLSVAGMTRAIPFDRKALRRVFEITRGVPRRINLLCDRAMLGSYAHGRHLIDVEVVEKSAREVFGSSEPSAPDRSFLGTAAGLGLVAAAGLALLALFGFALYGGYRLFVAPEFAASAPAPGKPVVASAGAAASTAASSSRGASAAASSAATIGGALASASSAAASSAFVAIGGVRRRERDGEDDVDRAAWRGGAVDRHGGRAENANEDAGPRREDRMERARSLVEAERRWRRRLHRGGAPAGALLQVHEHVSAAAQPRSAGLHDLARGRRQDRRGGARRP